MLSERQAYIFHIRSLRYKNKVYVSIQEMPDKEAYYYIYRNNMIADYVKCSDGVVRFTNVKEGNNIVKK